MKECVECEKRLGIVEGYHHPTMGRDYLLCSKCFDSISTSVAKWNEFISPYMGFFNKESSTIDDIQRVGENIIKSIKKIQNRVNNILSDNINQNANENLTTVH